MRPRRRASSRRRAEFLFPPFVFPTPASLRRRGYMIESHLQIDRLCGGGSTWADDDACTWPSRRRGGRARRRVARRRLGLVGAARPKGQARGPAACRRAYRTCVAWRAPIRMPASTSRPRRPPWAAAFASRRARALRGTQSRLGPRRTLVASALPSSCRRAGSTRRDSAGGLRPKSFAHRLCDWMTGLISTSAAWASSQTSLIAAFFSSRRGGTQSRLAARRPSSASPCVAAMGSRRPSPRRQRRPSWRLGPPAPRAPRPPHRMISRGDFVGDRRTPPDGNALLRNGRAAAAVPRTGAVGQPT